MKLDYINKITQVDERRLAAIPYPQANNPITIVKYVNAICQGYNAKEELLELFDMHERQIDYYSNACQYLGFVKKTNSLFIGTSLGYKLNESDNDTRIKLLIDNMLKIPSIKSCYESYIKNNCSLSIDTILEIFESNNIFLNVRKKNVADFFGTGAF